MTAQAPPVDARLLLPAAGAWLGAALATAGLGLVDPLVVRHEAARQILAAAALALLCAAGGLAIAVRRGHRREGRTSVDLAVCTLLVGVAAACLPVVAWTGAPVAEWVDARATAEVRGHVTSEAVLRHPAAGHLQRPGWTEVRLRVEGLAARGRDYATDLPILVRTDGDIRSPPPGSAVRVTGRLGPAPPRSAVAATLSGARWQVVGAPGPLDSVAHAMRTGLRRALAGSAPDPAALVAGLAVGDESGQPPELTRAMRNSGLAHLTAVSGGNVAIILGAVLGVATLARLHLVGRSVLALAALGYFVVLVGPEPSVLRAAVMGVAAVVAVLVGGRRAGPAVVSTAVILLVVVAPWLAVSWGFGLSVFATAGLVLLVPPILGRLEAWRWSRRWPAGLREAVALTVAAQVATLPLLVAMGGAVGWVAVPANLLAMPVVPLITVLGLLAAGLSPLLPAVAGLVAQAAAWPAGWIATVAHASAELPGSRLPWPTGVAGVVALGSVLAGGLGAWVLARRVPPSWRGRPVRTVVPLLLLAAAVVVLAWPPDRRGWPPPEWLVIMCDVGQGDALILNAGPGEAVIVDAGPDGDRLDACLDDAGIAAVPLVLLTHFHADHVRGLAGAFRGRGVSAVIATPVRDPAEEAAAVDAVLAEHGLSAVPVSAGARLKAGAVDLTMLWPRRRIPTGSVPNNASVVAVASVHGRHLLLAGDIEPEAQSALATELPRWRFAAVKVPHHGSRYQSPLLTTWAPAPVALISVGAGNDYGHPDAGTVHAWQQAGALVLRTDRDGDIALVATGSGVGVVPRGGMLPSP